jgi:hypothetical protein
MMIDVQEGQLMIVPLTYEKHGVEHLNNLGNVVEPQHLCCSQSKFVVGIIHFATLPVVVPCCVEELDNHIQVHNNKYKVVRNHKVKYRNFSSLEYLGDKHGKDDVGQTDA